MSDEASAPAAQPMEVDNTTAPEKTDNTTAAAVEEPKAAAAEEPTEPAKEEDTTQEAAEGSYIPFLRPIPFSSLCEGVLTDRRIAQQRQPTSLIPR